MKKPTKHLIAIGIAVSLALGLGACGSSSSEGTAVNSEVTTESTAGETEAAEESTAAAPAEASTAAETEETEAVPEIVGIYKVKEMISPDSAVSVDEIALGEEYGMAWYMVIAEDGSALMDVFGDQTSGTWDENQITMDGAAMDYSLDDDTLTLTEDDVSVILVRTTQEEIDRILANAEETLEGSSTEEDTEVSEETEQESPAVSGDYSTEETVLIDTDEAYVAITEYDTDDDFYGFVVKLRCENRTSDTDLLFSSSYGAINGYMVLPFFSKEVTAGNLVNTKIGFDETEFQREGITSVDELILALNVYDYDTFDTIFSDTVTVYPTGKSADEIVYPERNASEDDEIVADNDDAYFAITGMSHDDVWSSWELSVYIENRTDQTLSFSWDNIAVNGAMLDAYWTTEVMPGKKAYTILSFYDDELRENDIDEIESIEYELIISDAGDWFADPILDETFTWNP